MNTPRMLCAAAAWLLISFAWADTGGDAVPVTLTLGSPGTFGSGVPEGYCALAVSAPARARGTYSQSLVQESTINGPLQILGGQVNILKATPADQGTWVMTYVPTGIGPNQTSITIRYTVEVVRARPVATPTPKKK